MAKPPSSASDADTNALLIVIIALVFLYIVTTMIYENNRVLFNAASYVWVKAQLIFFLPLSDHAKVAWLFMDKTSPAMVSPAQMKALMAVGGQHGRWMIVPLLGLMFFLVYKKIGTIERFTRTFTMQTLLRHNAKLFPSLIPVAFRDKFILDEPTSRGVWRVSESPMLFALRNGIIKTIEGRLVAEKDCYTQTGLPRVRVKVPAGGFVFDNAAALMVMKHRMGTRFTGIMNEPDYIRGLAGALATIAIGRKEEGYTILDAMSKSFDEKAAVARHDAHEVPKGDIGINILHADQALQRIFATPLDSANSSTESDLTAALLARLKKHEEWTYVWLSELLTIARLQGGSTPAHDFIWLRPAHRRLWATMNDQGGDTSSVEGGAAWSHLLAEKKLGAPIPEPIVEPAVNALYYAIDAEGWFEMSDKKQ